jgi:hypothetical protein
MVALHNAMSCGFKLALSAEERELMSKKFRESIAINRPFKPHQPKKLVGFLFYLSPPHQINA